MADKEQCVREFSSFLSHTARELENVLCQLRWKKENLMKKASNSRLVHCPINPNHRIPASRLDRHLNVCRYTSKDIKPQDVCSSPEFFYQSSSAVIPVFIDEEKYSSFKNKSDRCELNQEPDKSSSTKTNPVCCSNGKSHLEQRPASSKQNILTKKQDTYSDLMDGRRSIMAWEVVPASHRRLELHLVPQDMIKTWIIQNLPQVEYLSSLEGASNRLVDFVLSCLQEEKVAHPSGMEEMLKDLLGNETQSFVLKLWKFLAVSISAEGNNTNQSSVEDRRQEFWDLNTTDTSDFHEPLPVENYIKEIPLPMDRVINELSPQQRLAVYEHVIQKSKAKREGQKEEVDMEVASDPNNDKDAANGQPKSRFEVLAEQRDYKRRRQSYRAKNVHITKRSAVEHVYSKGVKTLENEVDFLAKVMRDLIETQMQVLEMQYKDEHGISDNNPEEEDASVERQESRDQKDNTRKDSRDEEGRWRRERDSKQHREGGKRVRYHDDRDVESKRSRR